MSDSDGGCARRYAVRRLMTVSALRLLQTALEVLLRLTSDIQADGVASAAAMPELGATMCP